MEKLVIHQTVEEQEKAFYNAALKANKATIATSRYCSTEEACEILDVHRNTLRNYRLAGEFNVYRQGKKSRYKPAELIAFIERGKIG